MGATYIHISETLKGVSNDTGTGFFMASAKEWDAFFASSPKWETPPGNPVGPLTEAEAQKAFWLHWEAENGKKIAERDAYSHPYFDNYPCVESFLSTQGYRWHDAISPVTGKMVSYFAKEEL